MTPPQRFLLNWRRLLLFNAALLPLLALLGFILLGFQATSSHAASEPPAHPRLFKPAFLCDWIARNQAHLPPDLACPSLSDGGFEVDAGPDTTKPGFSTVKVSPSQEPTGPLAPPVHFGKNVDAADPNEDLASGQNDGAIAAAGRYVVAIWHDPTGIFSTDATLPQTSLTGVGFSNDGGKTFHDLVGLPNNNPCQQIGGPASVVSYQAPDGKIYFYIFSDYDPFFGGSCVAASSPTNSAGSGGSGGGGGGSNGGAIEEALTVGTVAPDGQSLALSNPIVLANGGTFDDPSFDILSSYSLAIDPVHGKLAMAYDAFGSSPGVDAFGQIDLAYCTLRTPAAPSCTPGATGRSTQVIANSPANGEEVQGGSLAFSPAGDLYVAWNQNWSTNLPFFAPIPNGDPFTHQFIARIPASCVAAPPCAMPPAISLAGPVKSLDAVFSPVQRGIKNDFPRLAFNAITKQAVVVWNEANAHPMGDIVLVTASADLRTLSPKVRVNDDNASALHYLPAVSVDAKGTINISWLDQRNAEGTGRTDVYAASIKVGLMGARNSQVTNVATDWNTIGADFFTIFGDYTNNTSDGTTFYVCWTDGRLGVPNPFVASNDG